MVKFYEGQSTFQYSWEHVAKAFWKRYPNPHSNHVLSEDIVERSVQGGKLFSKRFLIKTNRVPKWGERFVSARNVGIIEESVVDREQKTIITYTRNIGLNNLMSVIERVEYTVSPEDSNITVAKRQAWISSNIFGFSYAIQKFAFERFKKNCVKAALGFHFVLDSMYGSQAHQPELTFSRSFEEKKEKFKDAARETAKKAKELAKSTSIPTYASCSGSSSANI